MSGFQMVFFSSEISPRHIGVGKFRIALPAPSTLAIKILWLFPGPSGPASRRRDCLTTWKPEQITLLLSNLPGHHPRSVQVRFPVPEVPLVGLHPLPSPTCQWLRVAGGVWTWKLERARRVVLIACGSRRTQLEVCVIQMRLLCCQDS
jgi:hypothetical protein